MNQLKSIVITGATGFLGSHLIQAALKEGYQVTALSQKSRPSQVPEAVSWVQGSLMDEAQLCDLCHKQHAIFHTAAQTGIWGAYASYYQANVLGTRHLLDAAIRAGVPHFIYTSTPSVVFNGQSIVRGSEDLPYATRWLCAYAQTKAIAEQSVLIAARAGAIQALSLRPHLIWGPGDPHLFPRLIKRSQQKKLVQVGNAENWVDLTHIDNVVHAHLLALKALERGVGSAQAYFITQNEPVPLWPWMRSFLKAVGLPQITYKIPSSLAYGLGYMLEKIYTWRPTEPLMTRFLALELAKHHTFSSEKARQDLGYEPIITFAEGMQERIAYWQAVLSA